jgi:hypothetical protein
MAVCGTAKEAAEKCDLTREQRALGLKPLVILKGLRGPEGPLFHGDADICEFFRKL